MLFNLQCLLRCQINLTATGNVATPAETEIACRLNAYSFGIFTRAFCPVN